MKESAQAAVSYARARGAELGIPDGFFASHDIHIHVPEGAIPKDGPSAGITMATALMSAVSGRPVRRDVAMTGEITLRGEVLPVGGIKEKVLAARRAGISTVILPALCRRHLEEIPAAMRRKVKFLYVNDVEEVLRAAIVAPATRPRTRSRVAARTGRRRRMVVLR